MDSIQNIAISRIADILSCDKLIVPKPDIWKKIFYNAGLGGLYEDHRFQLTVTYKQAEDNYYHNGNCFSALLEIFLDVYDKFEEFVQLLNNVLDKFCLEHIFIENVGNIVKPYSYCDIVEYIKELKTNEEKNEILLKYPSDDFLLFKNNLNILSLDVTIQEKFTLVAVPFTFLSEQINKDTGLINRWLNNNHPNVFKSYEDAKNAYGAGDAVGCLTHCRNVITGFFTYKKAEQTEWVKGLQESCKKDKNITNIDSPNNIPNFFYNSHHAEAKYRYRYPRFNIIYKLYSYLSSLGAHVNEGNIVNDTIDVEDTDMKDAFMGLRMTEDVLIWLYQNET